MDWPAVGNRDEDVLAPKAGVVGAPKTEVADKDVEPKSEVLDPEPNPVLKGFGANGLDVVEENKLEAAVEENGLEGVVEENGEVCPPKGVAGVEEDAAKGLTPTD